MNKERDELFKEYLTDLKIKGYREQTIIGLRKDVPMLFRYLDDRGLGFNELKAGEVLDYQGWLIKKGREDGRPYKNTTIRSYMRGAMNFYEFLKERKLVLSNPFLEVKRIKIEKRIPRNLLKENELNLLLEELSHYERGDNLKQRITRYRVHIISELMYATGLRISEVAFLRVEDIDLVRGLVKVRGGKGGISRVALLNEYSREVLKLYMEEIRETIFNEWNWENKELVFGVKWRWIPRIVNRVLKEECVRLKFPDFRSHGFRHALGYHLLRAGCNIRHIQQILGHKRLRNTEIYTKVDKEDLKEILDTYHPRKWKRLQDEETEI